ncbi:MAG TPA: DUF3189 family protein [Syntrophomonadaceae bacterium]|nr:DUF3189 family protein [Syntrophomonadaceae bacterium]
MEIKVIYHCYGGSHSSVTAAGIHLGLLPRDRTASARELLQIPHFDTFEEIVHGHFRYAGRNLFNSAVYVLGKKTLGRRVSLLLKRLAEISGCGDRVYPVDTTGPINPLMVLGGFLSRRLRLVGIGRPLVILGTRLAYRKLSELVDRVEKALREKQETETSTFNPRRMVFYICPNVYRLALPVAGFHLNPDFSKEAVLKWAIEQKFTGEVGEISLVGHDGGYDVYLVGAGAEPEIVARILREYGGLIGIPRSSWFVVEAPAAGDIPYFLLAKIFKLFHLGKGLYFCERRAFRNLLDFYRREAYRIKMCLKEGILD